MTRDMTIAGPIHCDECHRQVTRRHFYSSGRSRCRNQRRWSDADLFAVMDLADRGCTDQRIATVLTRRLGRPITAVAVELVRKRRGIRSGFATALSATDVARMLGVRCPKTVARWVAAGWLRGRRGAVRGDSRTWRVRREDLWAFVGDEAHWHRWDPARITDHSLRLHVATVRPADAVYLTAAEARRRLQERGVWVELATVCSWAQKGWLPSVRNGNHLFRPADVDRLATERLTAGGATGGAS